MKLIITMNRLYWTRGVLKCQLWNEPRWWNQMQWHYFSWDEGAMPNENLFNAMHLVPVLLNRRIRISLKWQMTSLWLLQTLAATCPRLLISCHLLLKSSQSEALILTQWPIRSPHSFSVTNERAAAAFSRLSTILAPCRLFISQTSGPWAWGTLNWKPSENCICLVLVIL